MHKTTDSPGTGIGVRGGSGGARHHASGANRGSFTSRYAAMQAERSYRHDNRRGAQVIAPVKAPSPPLPSINRSTSGEQLRTSYDTPEKML